MIGTVVLGALSGAAYGQAVTPAPAPAAEPKAPGPVTAAPPALPAGPAIAPGVAPVAPAAPVAAPARPGVLTLRAAPAKLEKVPYLGVVTSSAPVAMRDQLKLAPGTGLVVDQLEPGSAAEKAGLKQHDILERLDDQLLINPRQLAALLLSKHPGDEVTLAIVRQGERHTIKARLEEKEVDINAYRSTGGSAGGGEFLPLQAITLDPTGNARIVTGTTRMPADANWAVEGFPGGKRVTVRALNDGTQTTVWADDEVSISIERRGGKTANMVIKDKKTDKPIYTGNGDGDGLERLLDARPELKDKVKKAQDAANRDAVRLQLTPPAPGAKGAAAGGGFGGGGVAFFGGGFGGAGGKVARWQDDNHVLLMRMAGRSPTYLLALSKKDGRTLFDGPVANEDDRRSVPAEIAEQFQMICAQPDMAQELGAPDKATADKPAAEALPRTK
jgi:hypothetical protein